MRTITEADLEAYSRRSAADLARIAAKGEPPRRRRSHSAAARRRMREAQLEIQRQRDDAHDSRLRRVRLEAGLSWPMLARKANVSVRSISRAEAGDRSVSRLTWARLAAALRVKPEDIRP